MEKQYIKSRTARLYNNPTGQTRRMVLIYGDEVETSGVESSGRKEATFRTRNGWIQETHLDGEHVLEVYFIDVGTGDSTYIVTPDRKRILIDGGINDVAVSFLAWKYRLEDATTPVKIDLLVLTHADDDHMNGLKRIVDHPKIQIEEIIHSGIARFKSGTHETELGDLITQDGEEYLITRHDKLEELSDADLSDSFNAWKESIQNKSGITYRAVDTSSPPVNIGNPQITLTVVGPKVEERVSDNSPIFRWFGDESRTINGHSVMLRISYKDATFLFSGDLNVEGAEYIMQDNTLRNLMDAHVLKAPHHGSHKYSRPWLDAVNPLVSVISSGDYPDHGHPRANFVGTVGQASRSNEPMIFSTELARNYISLAEIEIEKELELSREELDALDDTTLGKLRSLFKMRLPGMINVRTNGNSIYAMRRVATGYWWESYGPLELHPRSNST